MSSDEPPAATATPASAEGAAAARSGVREAVKAAGSGRPGSRWLVPGLAVAAVAAAACAPVAWPLLAGGAAVSSAALAAAFSQVGGVGGGLLAGAVASAWDRLRGQKDAGAGIGLSELRTALEAELATSLGASSPMAAELRAEVAGVLQEVGAVKVALTTIVETTTGEARDQILGVLTSGLQALGSQFAEFGWLLGEVRDRVTEIAVTQAELLAGTRAVRDDQQLMGMQLILLLRRLSPEPAPAPPAGAPGAPVDAGPGAARDAADGPEPECPYPGLAAFEPNQVGLFFGREELTARVAMELAGQVAAPGLMMVVGPSGSGKSSLLRAGLLPAVAGGDLLVRGSREWPLVIMTPGSDPLRELAARITDVVPGNMTAGALETDLRADPARVTADIRQALLARARRLAELGEDGVAEPGSAPLAGAAAVSSRLVLVIDQFEELFTQCPEQERQPFIQALCAAAGVTGRAGPPGADGWPREEAGSRGAPALVVIGIRADFYDRCAATPELRPYLEDAQLLVPPMSEAGLRAAIEGPAAVAGLAVEPGLVEIMLAELGPAEEGYEAGRLPLLAYALQQTWEHREARRLTVAGYRAAGGIDGAVARAADAVYDRLDAPGQLAARTMLLRMVNLGEGTPDTRRQVRLDELTGLAGPAGFPPGQQADVVRAVLAALVRARLLTAEKDTVTITHEALLTAWPKLHEWLSTDREGQRTRREVSDAASTWQANRDDTSRLLGGTRLAVAREWAAGNTAELNAEERDFLDASWAYAQRSARRRRLAVGALGILTVASVLATGLAVQQSHSAQAERNAAIVNEVAAEAGQLQSTDPSLAAQLELVGHRLEPGSSNSALLGSENTALANPLPGDISGVAFSPRGGWLATASPDGAVRLWDVARPADPVPLGRPLDARDSDVDSVAWSPAGNVLAASYADGTIRLWDVSRPAHPVPAGTPLRAPADDLQELAFSPDGDTLAAAGIAGTIRLWDVARPADATAAGPPMAGTGGRIWSVAFSPDGTTLAAGNNDDTVSLWDVGDPAHPAPFGKKPLTGPTGPVFSVAFSPGGQVLAAGDGSEDAVRLWNVTSPANAAPIGAPLQGADNTVSGVAFSPNGQLLAASSQDDKIRLWNIADIADPTPVGQPLIGSSSSGPVYAVAFSPAGSTLASVSGSGTALLWSLPATVLTGQTGLISSVAFSPDGRVLATASYDNTIRLWNVINPGRPVLLNTLTVVTGSVMSVAFSPDGETLASASYGGAIRLWNVTDPGGAFPIGQLLTGSGSPFGSVAFSPDGKTLAAGSQDGTIRLWNVTDPATAIPIGSPLTGTGSAVNSVAFSPDGRVLAGGGSDGTVRLWNVSRPAAAAPLGHSLDETSNNVFTVAFSPDGKTLAAGGAEDDIGLWDVADPAHAVRMAELTGPTNAVQSVAFSPDGTTLAAGSGDDTIWRWNVTRPARATVIGQPFTDASSVFAVAFSPDSRALATGSNNGTTELWNLDVTRAVDRICATSADNLTPQQWADDISQLSYSPPCASG